MRTDRLPVHVQDFIDRLINLTSRDATFHNYEDAKKPLDGICDRDEFVPAIRRYLDGVNL
jgi:hypothetical protein